MPREAHKRGSDVHTRGLSSEKVCVTCMISEAGISYARPAKLGNHRRDREDTVRQLLGQILCARMTVRNRSISARAPLPCL